MGKHKSTGINDPIHGVINVSPSELALIDSRPLQRLRFIKQLGLSEFAFPGACHSRFAHSLGAMHMASRMFDGMLAQCEFVLAPADADRFRQAVRLATLCHDLGHPPLSHVSERMMPRRDTLALPVELGPGPESAAQASGRQASHEDYTLLLLYDSQVTQLLNEHFAPLGIDAGDLAALITGEPPSGRSPFLVSDGHGQPVDWLPALHAIISGELDADRMDYLRRDAHHTGVTYGAFDANWLCANLSVVPSPVQPAAPAAGPSQPAPPAHRRLALALRHKAVWGFENFLLARYHMFLAVYYHHTSVCFEHLLGRFFAEGEYLLPSEVEAYLETDDVQLWSALRRSSSLWAKAICERRSWSLALETHHFTGQGTWEEGALAMRAAGIDFFVTESLGRLSRYFGSGAMHLQVVEPERARIRPIDAYTPLYQRFAAGVQLMRIYCQSKDLPAARKILRATSASAV